MACICLHSLHNVHELNIRNSGHVSLFVCFSLRTTGRGFVKIDVAEFFGKKMEPFKFYLKLDTYEYNKDFTRRTKCVSAHISLNILEERNISRKNCRKRLNTHFISNILSFIYLAVCEIIKQKYNFELSY